jgi:outer membrane protein OmpA-like peptidoglycan-associated protein
MATPGQVPTTVPTPKPVAVPGQAPSIMATPGQVPTAVPLQQPVAAPGLAPSVILIGNFSMTTHGNEASGTQASHLLINHHESVAPKVGVYKGRSAEVTSMEKTEGEFSNRFHLVMAGINTPDYKYNFLKRPTSDPGTFIFYFDFASVKVRDDQIYLYDEIVKKYRHRKAPIIVIGETDGFGSKAYNTALAHHRSSIIIEELIKRGIKYSDMELRLKIRCCQKRAVTTDAVIATQNERITWVHFE